MRIPNSSRHLLWTHWSEPVIAWLVRVALCMAVLVYFVPLVVNRPGDGLDPSWVMAMGYASNHGLVPGRDIAFTFGPYFAIFTHTYYPASNFITLIGAAFLALCYLIALFLVMRRHVLLIQMVLVVALSAAFYTRDAIFFSYPLLFAILCFRLVDVESRLLTIRLEQRGGLFVLALLAAPLGLYPLIKGTLMLICGGILVLSVLFFLSVRKYRAACVLVMAALLSMLLFWMLAEGSLATLPGYFISMQPIVAGYSEAQQNAGPSAEWICYLIGALALLLGLVRSVRYRGRAGLFIVLAYALFLFVTFKAGFVRQRGHSIVASEALVFAALFLYCMSRSRGFALAVACAAAVFVYIDSSAFNLSSKGLLENPLQTYQGAFDGIGLRLARDGALQRRFEQSLAAIAAHGKLVHSEGSTDVYPWDQAYLIAAGDSWDPRPTFQSYSAYTPALALANRNHLLGDKAPDNVLFRVDTFDGQLPSLDDGASWPLLLTHYRAVRYQNGFIYLEHKDTDRLALSDVQQVVSDSVETFDHAVAVPFSQQPIMVELYFKRSLLGSLANLLFKPANLSIALQLESGEVKNFRMISGMSETGFLISPLVESTDDFAQLLAGAGYLPGHRVRSLTLSAPDGAAQWQHQYRLVFKKINVPAGRDAAKLIAWNQPVTLPSSQRIVSRALCDGLIETTQGVASPNAASNTNLLKLSGWAALSSQRGLLPDAILIALEDQYGQRLFYSTTPLDRPDVAQYFNKKGLSDAGFSATIDVSQLKGPYRFGIALQHGDQTDVCALSGAQDFHLTPPLQQQVLTKPDWSVEAGVACDGTVDTINGAPPDGLLIDAAMPIEVSGWLARSASQGVAAGMPLLVLTNQRGEHVYFGSEKIQRSDVASHYHQAALANAGFRSDIDAAGLKGAYQLRLGYLDGTHVNLCRKAAIPLTFF